MADKLARGSEVQKATVTHMCKSANQAKEVQAVASQELSGLLIAFSVVLLLVCLIIIGHSLSMVVEQEKQDMAVLKTLGLSGSGLQGLYLILYGGAALVGLFLGLAFLW